MFEALLEGLFAVFQWPAIGFLLLGVLLGIWLGAVPGLGGIIGLVLLLPFTFGMDTIPAFALLLGMFAVTSTSDTIASVMLGIPGTAASQATILDGYPLAQQGKAARAFGAAFTVSAFGGVFGAIILAVSLPLILPIIKSFASPELFVLGMLGLAMVGSLSGGSILKGLTVAALGILLSTVGYGEAESIPRFHFETDYLLDNLPLIPVVLGLFAIPELMELAIRNVSISRVPKDQTEGGGMLEGVKDVFRHWWLALRCAAIGTYVGMLPGLGAAIVDWVAYGHAVQSAKDKSKFGFGDIRGVIAPEAANNATRGGSLIPTVAFGIPGSLGTAILLGALLIQGLKPGPDMLTTELHITFSMVWTIVIANIVAAGLLMVWSKQVAKIAFLPGHLIVPGVILFVFLGAWLGGAAIGDWISCLAFGIIGYVMKRGGWPRPPLILALILGNIMENAFQISMGAHGGFGWLSRPVVLIVIALIALTILLSARGITKNKAAQKADADDPASAVRQEASEGGARNPLLSLPFTIILFVLFTWAGLQAFAWPESVREFPLMSAVPGAVMVFFVLISDSRQAYAEIGKHGGLSPALAAAFDKALLNKASMFFGYLLVMILVMPFIGQKFALPLFILVYLIRWGGYNWRIAGGYAFGGWLMIVGFYDRILDMLWYPSWLDSWLPELLPSWLPRWFFV
ncbi:MAG: tripartite tricarboxylate transporter permease [Rhodospirillaceae bacterium]|nr:tripartite tricarboxylate transporter permease [Rhodospirillaceae bacterium]MBT4115397.1 tripartite tricarboxylate transporter permease [Rhodospirillaceae bacterium]MBT4671038.1 tripartite tricarboxylate transporter permease [Rhodospirillaceae bacterium]MBT4721258.1 tripartite tricarboxylate transporter permease [Rhodospirillaceae bacterium]MBT4750721.1 tripartite tricarboxylate transporter permease [Rhodospirillaceae bacterium]